MRAREVLDLEVVRERGSIVELVRYLIRWTTLSAILMALCLPASAHDTPFSYIDLHLKSAGVEGVVEAPAADFAHYLRAVEPEMLLADGGAAAHSGEMFALLNERLVLLADGRSLK